MSTLLIILAIAVFSALTWVLFFQGSSDKSDLDNVPATRGTHKGQKIRAQVNGRNAILYRSWHGGQWRYFSMRGQELLDVAFDITLLDVILDELAFYVEGSLAAEGDVIYETGDGEYVYEDGEAFVPQGETQSIIDSTPVELSESPSDAFDSYEPPSFSEETRAAASSYSSDSCSSSSDSYSSSGDYGDSGGSFD